jgi:hypothetical protein
MEVRQDLESEQFWQALGGRCQVGIVHEYDADYDGADSSLLVKTAVTLNLASNNTSANITNIAVSIEVKR